MKNCLRVLSQPAPSLAGEADLAADQQEREGALELLADLCENMDNAAGTPGCPAPAARAPPLPLPSPLTVPPLRGPCPSSPGSHHRPLAPLPPPASSVSLSSLLPHATALSLPAWSPCHQEGTFPLHRPGSRSASLTFSHTGHFSLVSWECAVTPWNMSVEVVLGGMVWEGLPKGCHFIGDLSGGVRYEISSGQRFQAEAMASAKALRWEHFWDVRDQQ